MAASAIVLLNMSIHTNNRVRENRSRNLDTYSANFNGERRYAPQYESQHESDNTAILPANSNLARNSRFWVISSLALFSLIMGILLASLVHGPRCPQACDHETCIMQVMQTDGELRDKKYDCTCSSSNGHYCANKEQSMQDKSVSAVSTLFFVLFFIVLILSCAFMRCLNRSDDRRVGIDDEIQMVRTAQAEISVHNDANVCDVHEFAGSSGTSGYHTPTSPNYSHGDMMDNIPVATAARKPFVPTAVAVAV